jgi:hypothetical protein
MADQIVITEKTSQAKDVRAAVGSRYGDILPAEGHLFDLLQPEDVVPAWKRWSPILVEAEVNARWSLDFVHDQLAQGRRFRNPLVPSHLRPIDRDLIRGGHYGQRSCEPHL